MSRIHLSQLGRLISLLKRMARSKGRSPLKSAGQKMKNTGQQGKVSCNLETSVFMPTGTRPEDGFDSKIDVLYSYLN